MNNKEFIAELSRRVGYTQEQTQSYVRTLVEEMTNILGEGESIATPSFGTFEVKKWMERILTNPSTSKKMLVPSKLVPSFRPMPSVKERLKKGGDP